MPRRSSSPAQPRGIPKTDRVLRSATPTAAEKKKAPPLKPEDIPLPSHGLGRELFSALTMPAVPGAVMLFSDAPPLLYTVVLCVHTCASMAYHQSLAASQTSYTLRPFWVRASMDADMILVHLLSIASAYSLAVAGGALFVDAGLICALLINLAGIALIATSRNYGPALAWELDQIRYPIIGLSVFAEAGLSYLRGASRDACGTAVCMALVCSCVLLDKRLGGWGHGLMHLFLLPGAYLRANALSVCMRLVVAGGAARSLPLTVLPLPVMCVCILVVHSRLGRPKSK